MKFAIFGANGPVGLILTEMALEQGHEVTAVTRRPDEFPIEHEHLNVVRGDVFNLDDVEAAIQGNETVISLFGVPYSFGPIEVYSKGTANIIEAMSKLGLKRLVCCTSGGTNPKFDLSSEGIIFGLIIKPIIGRTMYKDMRDMEELVMASDLDWTIARPARLMDSDEVGDYRTAQGYMVEKMRETNKHDLAHFMLEEAVDPKHTHQALAIASP